MTTISTESAAQDTFAIELKALRYIRKRLAQARTARAAWNLKQAALHEAKPCPYCGDAAHYTACGVRHSLLCPNPDCPVQPYVEMDLANSTTLELVESWNSRSDEPKTPEQTILDGMQAVEPAATVGALVSIRELRAHVNLDKAAFDAACLKLRREWKVSMSQWPYLTVTPEEAQAYVHDGQGNYFNGIAIRTS